MKRIYSIFVILMNLLMIRNDWTYNEIKKLYHQPLLELVYKAAMVNREYHDPLKMKISMLISVKTGACAEDCSYCAQSSRYKTHVSSQKTLSVDEVMKEAADAKSKGVERVCLSASWREIPEGKAFDDLLKMIAGVKEMGLSVCCTTGMLNKNQSAQLAEAGITAYNHNLDTSDEYYPNIISTRSYQERLDTINCLIDAKVQHCTGGIIGMGESENDRISMIHKLATLRKHPYTVPLNMLVPIEGTPLEKQKPVEVFEMLRMIATVRNVMPESKICLAAGRKQMSDEGQALCFMAGANSIFVGTKLLTTPNPEMESDLNLLNKLGLQTF
ncbi:MAG: biotin synthase BioB [Bacteroidota bacterium]